jgi:ribose/xylose/arabinose/galactoside ABC-type transport system permease subunit
MAGLLAAVMGLLTSTNYARVSVAIAVPMVLLLGTALGLLNGVLVAYLRVPSIIVTLGMLTALRGVTELLMAGKWIQNLPDGLRFFGTGTVLSLPVSVLTALIMIVASMALATRTPLGRRIYAVGSNVHAARLAGLSPRRIKLFVFTFTGFLVAVATLISVPKLSVIDPAIGKGWELFVVTTVVVGGTSISGGKGTIIGGMIAVLLLGTIGDMLTFLKVEQATYWERAIQGAFILLAVLADHIGRRGGHEDGAS